MSVNLIPERLKEIREAKGLNKMEASRIMGVTQSGYVRYELGERKPTIQTVEAMAAALGTSVGYLTGESDDPSPDRVLILKSEDPVLFELARNLTSAEDSQKKRILTYASSLLSDRKAE